MGTSHLGACNINLWTICFPYGSARRRRLIRVHVDSQDAKGRIAENESAMLGTLSFIDPYLPTRHHAITRTRDIAMVLPWRNLP